MVRWTLDNLERKNINGSMDFDVVMYALEMGDDSDIFKEAFAAKQTAMDFLVISLHVISEFLRSAEVLAAITANVLLILVVGRFDVTEETAGQLESLGTFETMKSFDVDFVFVSFVIFESVLGFVDSSADVADVGRLGVHQTPVRVNRQVVLPVVFERIEYKVLFIVDRDGGS